MIRTSHAILDRHKHALWQYVDDLFAWLDKQSAPLWASCLVSSIQSIEEQSTHNGGG